MIQAQLREQFPVESTPVAPSSQPGFWAGLRSRQIAMLAVGLVFVLVKSYESLQAFFLTHPEVRMALLGSSAAAGLTALGALGVLFTRRISERTQDVLLGYGGGIMLAASVFSLIIPAMNQAQTLGYEKTGAVLLTATGIMLGGLFVLAINHLIPHQHFIAPNPTIQSMRTSRIWMFVMAVTIHNFPEGLAIGVGFGGDEMGKAIALATGIGIQDIPEGLVVALALRSLGYSPWKSAGAGILSGLVEPIGGVLGALATGVSATALPWALAGAGGAMLFVISHEVIPESHRQGHETQATLGLLAGFVTMMLLDTLLG